MNCNEIRNIIPEYLEQALEQKQIEQVKQHLQTCLLCQKEVRAYEKIWATLDQWKDVEPQPGYVSRFWTRLALKQPWYIKWGRTLNTIFLKKSLAPFYAVLSIVLIVGYITFKTTTQVYQTETVLTALNSEEMELVDNLELTENLELIEELEFLEDLEIIENLDAWGVS